MSAAFFIGATPAFPQRLGDEHSPDFEKEVAPLLIKRCVECHHGSKPSGGLALTSESGLLAGGDSGAVIRTEDPMAGLFMQHVSEGVMPPEKQGRSQKLADEEIEVLRRWITAGAHWPQQRKLDWFERTNDVRAGRDWWSLQPIVKPGIPKISTGTQPKNPVDAFVIARLEQHGMTPADQADKRTLLRRLYFDLIGLPPSIEQIEAFEMDESPGAWERQIDVLLEKPQYGERWARYWLDVARFAETSGYERDQEKTFAWRYRDWVVDAFNSDMPFDRFIIEQLAGDEIDKPTEQSVIATGFLRLGTWNDEPNEPLDYQYDRLEDMVHTTSSAFIGLTVKCARCHAHKFDPITQDDYYRMASAFWAGPIGARDRKFLGGPSPQELGFQNVLGWTDVSPDPPPLHVLANGERAHPLHEVVPASLSAVPALEVAFMPAKKGSKTSQRRLQLARWIARSDNPLTSRVIVNRLWQHHFGAAIVRTPNNFGFHADTPTHPHLLNWLAAEFLENGQSIKHLHRLILRSSTWKQASVHSLQANYRKHDPSNRLWWQAQRRRLDAEALRDSMLAVSGELELTVGGESFRPTISEEALEGLSQKSAAWSASPPERQNRRSLYAFLKRGLLPPMMTAFDLCDATLSCGKRDVTTVPTQALALMNNAFVHDRCQAMASKMLAETPSLDAQVANAWEQILARKASPRELRLGRRHLIAQQRNFSDERDSSMLALASLCQVLLNSNEFLYID